MRRSSPTSVILRDEKRYSGTIFLVSFPLQVLEKRTGPYKKRVSLLFILFCFPCWRWSSVAFIRAHSVFICLSIINDVRGKNSLYTRRRSCDTVMLHSRETFFFFPFCLGWSRLSAASAGINQSRNVPCMHNSILRNVCVQTVHHRHSADKGGILITAQYCAVCA